MPVTTTVSTRRSLFCRFEIPAENVNVPTIRVVSLGEGRDPEVIFQWFGRDFLENRDLGNEQFFFPTMSPPSDTHWMNHPEKFRVIFVGPISEWPEPAARAQFDMPQETYVLWVASAHYGTRHSTGIGPACFMIPLKVTLADQEAGIIIKPKKFADLGVLEAVNREFAVSTT